jgi:Zn-dependent metalloprotease
VALAGRHFVLCLSLLFTVPAQAIVRPPDPVDGEIRPDRARGVRIAGPSSAPAFDARPTWREFQSRHGDWQAEWNTVTKSPHRAWGPSFSISGSVPDAKSADGALRSFIAGNPGVFGSPSLEVAGIHQVNGLWYARYRQTIQGVPVLFSDWEFRLSESGKLMMFGADAHTPSVAPRVSPKLVRAAAREQARRGVAFSPAKDKFEDGGVYFLPWSTETGVEYRLVYEQRVITEEPPAHWVAFVDADNGEVLYRMNRVRHVISGRITGDVHTLLPTEPFVSGSFANARIWVGPDSGVTSVTGNYSVAATGTVQVRDSLIGPFCDVNNNLPSIAVFTTTVANPATVNIHWNDTNSHVAERDAFFHANRAHDFIKTLDPGFTQIDYPMPTRVNINLNCNAFWNGTGINFYVAGSGCPNTATIPDVVYHEYGHGINDMLYTQAGSFSGMFNGALHEGMADVHAAFMQDNPNIGKGFNGPGTILRTCDNTRRWPDDAGEAHTSGQIISGAFWDLRQAVGLTIANQLAHFARYGIPDDPLDDGVAMSEYFIETLIADDNDANLANGTPHFSQIVSSFNAHGIGTGFFVEFIHAPLADNTGTGNYPVTAFVQYTGPVGSLDASSPTLHYSVNGSAYFPVSMTPTGNPDEFTAVIPGQPAGIVNYYLTAADVYGATNTHPPVAPSRETFTFLAGPASTVFQQTMEANPLWTVGDPTDNATSGIWERGNPNGTLVDGINVQPEDDHTPFSGTVCWFTGQHPLGESNVGLSDVDGGKTTLNSNVFDGVTGTNYPVIEYYRWYTNQLGGAPSSDYWRTYISNDGGGTWAVVENTLQSKNAWQRVLFFVHDFVTPTTTMRLRFVAADSASGSLVEAGVDDVRLLTYPMALSVGGPGPSREVLLAPPSPNPMRSHASFSFTLPSAGSASLRVFDIHGRVVRTLHQGALEAGPHAREWNGLDDRGRRVPSGPYFVRLEHGLREAVRKVVRVE